MKLIYIAGPFRGRTPWDVEENIRRAERVALAVWQAGAAALCPHTNTRFFNGAAPDDIFLRGTMEMLRRSDAVFLTYGWPDSKGTIAEIDEAFSRNLPIFDEGSMFRRWLFNNESCGLTLPALSERMNRYRRLPKF